MKLKVTKLVGSVLIASALAAAFGLAGCSSNAADNATNETPVAAEQGVQIPVPLVISAPAFDGNVIYDSVVTVPEGATALDVLQACGYGIDVQESEYGKYVNEVNGVANEGMKGWTYLVNNAQPTVSADQTVIKNGDKVEWTYIDMS